jgi:hypothetical protein
LQGQSKSSSAIFNQERAIMAITVEQSQINADTGTENTEYAPSGYKVVGVGWKVQSPERQQIIVTNWPTSDAGGWNFVMDYYDGSTVTAQMDVWLVCSDSV